MKPATPSFTPARELSLISRNEIINRFSLAVSERWNRDLFSRLALWGSLESSRWLSFKIDCYSRTIHGCVIVRNTYVNYRIILCKLMKYQKIIYLTDALKLNDFFRCIIPNRLNPKIHGSWVLLTKTLPTVFCYYFVYCCYYYFPLKSKSWVLLTDSPSPKLREIIHPELEDESLRRRSVRRRGIPNIFLTHPAPSFLLKKSRCGLRNLRA